MKTKDLIAELQKCDPEGDSECVVGGVSVLGAGKEPGFWDGPYEVLEHDGGRITNASFTRSGWKVVIWTRSIEDALFDNPRLPVSCDFDGPRKTAFLNWVEEQRREAHAIRNRSECDHFAAHMHKRGVSEEKSRAFFEQRLTWEDPMPPDILEMRMPSEGRAGLSWIEMRSRQWDRQFTVRDGEILVSSRE